MKQRRPGFTIVELLVVVSIIALLIAILLPAIGKARDAARMTQSQGNLRNLSVACDTYAADWGDRQWTAVPDDAGLVGGDGVVFIDDGHHAKRQKRLHRCATVQIAAAIGAVL